MRKIGWGIGAVAVVVAGAFAFTLLTDAPKGTEPGVCAHIEKVEQGAKYRPLDCGAADANVRVAKVVDEASQCPKGGAPYTIFTRADTLCLIPNFVQGACYQGDRESGMKKVDCTTAEAIKVASVAREPVECANGQKLTYVEPVVTFCLVRASDMG
ncbi:hypothetical protein ADK67_23620 [Saccharothrix sp. NRRL B-16348]|jgi:hypothetical protein|uniref:LppU/SCO3897 family protein n=1 Tax=Saccharothrix sp. NRRL B-16348 TaxID=1415542 RepID=UPI0006ADB492|nr:hypothetical protein [Saccharothrix sp. NRRL B-16348]KOX22640.1 hypothetical protein ADK67_23620 [Saccharothrix sp. NRRL B-16348]